MDERALRSGLTRRDLLRHAAVLGGGGLLASACGTPIVGASPAGGLAFWDLFGGGDGARMQTMEQMYLDANPQAALEAVTLEWGAPYYTKLAMSAAGGRAPDVAVLHLSRLAGYAPTGLLDPFDPELLTEFDLTEDRFSETLWPQAQYDGSAYAIPLDTHPYVMYYHTEICQQAGLLDADGVLKPLEGPDALMGAFVAAQEHTEWGVITETLNPWRLWWTLYSQLGGTLLDGDELVLDTDKGIEALAFMQRLTVEEKVHPPTLDYPGLVAQFLSGNAGFMFNGEWEVSTMVDAEIPFDMLPFPQVYDDASCQADSHALVLPHQRDPDPEVRRQSMQFIASLLGNSLEWAKGGHVPAYQPVATSDAYQELKPQSNYAAAADRIKLDPEAWFSGSGSQLEAEAGGAFGACMSGQLAPEPAIRQFGAAIEDLLSLPPPS